MKQQLMNLFEGISDSELVIAMFICIGIIIMLIHPIPFIWNTSPILGATMNTQTVAEQEKAIQAETLSYKFTRLDSPHSEVFMGINNVQIQYDYYMDNLTGSSMEPAILPGDILLMRRMNNPYEIKEGYNVHCEWVDAESKMDVSTVHRVVGIYDGFFLTQGDRNAFSDSHHCLFSEVKGYVVAIIPGGRATNQTD